MQQSFVSIDPGLKNVGWCYGNLVIDETKKVVTIQVLKAGNSLVVGSAKFDLSTYSALIKFFVEKFPKVDKLIIEHQFWSNDAYITTRKLQLVERLIKLYFSNKGSGIVELNSCSYKSQLGISSKKGNAKNKKLAIEFCKLYTSEQDFKNHIGKCHHIADALNQVYYWGQQLLKELDFDVSLFQINTQFF